MAKLVVKNKHLKKHMLKFDWTMCSTYRHQYTMSTTQNMIFSV